MFGGFPCGSMLKNPPAHSGDTGSIPGPERSHIHGATKPVLWNQGAKTTSPRAATTEAWELWNPGSPTRESTQGEACTLQLEKSCWSPQQRKARPATKTQRGRKKIKLGKLKKYGIRLPWWSSVKDLPCGAGHWWDSWSGNVPILPAGHSYPACVLQLLKPLNDRACAPGKIRRCEKALAPQGQSRPTFHD